MYAIQFDTTVKDGIIVIPRRYVAQLRSRLKVIVLQEESAASPESLKRKDAFFARVAEHRFELPKDYSFRREDIYDRT